MARKLFELVESKKILITVLIVSCIFSAWINNSFDQYNNVIRLNRYQASRYVSNLATHGENIGNIGYMYDWDVRFFLPYYLPRSERVCHQEPCSIRDETCGKKIKYLVWVRGRKPRVPSTHIESSPNFALLKEYISQQEGYIFIDPTPGVPYVIKKPERKMVEYVQVYLVACSPKNR